MRAFWTWWHTFLAPRDLLAKVFTLGVALVLGAACEAARPTDAKPAVSVAPPAPAAPAPPTRRASEAAGVEFIEVATGGANLDDKLPMVIAIHGLGDRPEAFVSLLDSYPAKVRLIVPRGLDPHPAGHSWFPVRARDDDKDALATGMRRASDALAAMIAELHGARPTKGRPFVTGFSQGGMLTFALAAEHPEVVGMAVPVAGLLPEPMRAVNTAPNAAPIIRALHGEADVVVAFDEALETTAALRKAGWDVQMKTYPDLNHRLTRDVRNDLVAHLDQFVEGLS